LDDKGTLTAEKDQRNWGKILRYSTEGLAMVIESQQKILAQLLKIA